MKPFNLRSVLYFLTVALSGCSSSPPEPVAVKWDAPTAVVNSTLPEWQENNVVVPSPGVAGNWSKRITDFQGDSGSYGPDFYYAVAHSTRIVVVSNSGAAWFEAKEWLRAHGATGPIEFTRQMACLTCNRVDVYLSRPD
jgi:Cag pathogenicity island protein Cag12